MAAESCKALCHLRAQTHRCHSVMMADGVFHSRLLISRPGSGHNPTLRMLAGDAGLRFRPLTPWVWGENDPGAAESTDHLGGGGTRRPSCTRPVS